MDHYGPYSLGNCGRLLFSGFENLTGRNSTRDAFTIMTFGSVTGTLSGGTGSLDGFAVVNALGDMTVFQPASNDAGGSTTLGGKIIAILERASFQSAGCNGQSGRERRFSTVP